MIIARPPDEIQMTGFVWKTWWGAQTRTHIHENSQRADQDFMTPRVSFRVVVDVHNILCVFFAPFDSLSVSFCVLPEDKAGAVSHDGDERRDQTRFSS